MKIRFSARPGYCLCAASASFLQAQGFDAPAPVLFALEASMVVGTVSLRFVYTWSSTQRSLQKATLPLRLAWRAHILVLPSDFGESGRL
jgi:hypothetical protein